MKASELIEYLKNLDPNKPVGFKDHFGKFIPLETKHLRVTRIEGWKPTKSAVVIEPPDIGPEPD